jgi:hypothetical protein
MPLTRHQTKVPVSQTEFRYRVVVKTDPCEAASWDAKRLQFELLQNIGMDQMLSLCGSKPFQKMTMKHDGTQWVAEFEAIVAESQP